MNSSQSDQWRVAYRGDHVVKDCHCDARLGRPVCFGFGQHDDHDDEGCGQGQDACKPVGAGTVGQDDCERIVSHSPMMAYGIEVVLTIPILLS